MPENQALDLASVDVSETNWDSLVQSIMVGDDLVDPITDIYLCGECRPCEGCCAGCTGTC